jgi:molybdopterin molybdotransferase
MLTFAEGMKLVEGRCRGTANTEYVAIGDASGRILSDNIFSPIGYPPADNSAVDGYAFDFEDSILASTGRVKIRGTAAAGHPFEGRIGPGEAIRIYTGALVPQGANAVVMQEHVVHSDDTILIPAESRRRSNIRYADEDIFKGACILDKGDVLTPARIGLLASLGITQVKVQRRIKVAIFSIGDELQSLGGFLQAGKIYESNRVALKALVEEMGAIPIDCGVIPDARDDVIAALRHASDGSDAIISSAGASGGGEDHVKAALGIAGAIDFAGLRLKPGRPTIFGCVGNTPYFALPGNPVAALTCFALIARGGLLRLAGATVRSPLRIPLLAGFSLVRKAGYLEFLRGVLENGSDGPSLSLFHRNSVGSVRALAQCDGLIELGEDVTEVHPGMTLPFIPLGEIGL